MINMDAGIEIFYDGEKTKEVEELVFKKYTMEKEWKERYHVIECTLCEMKCYNRRIGMVRKPTKENIGFLVFGIIAENIVMSIYPEEQRQYEANLIEQIWGHLDAFEDFTYPIEGKASAKRIFKRSQVPKAWVKQVINYLTITDKDRGWIYILDIYTRKFAVWCVRMTKEARNMQVVVLLDKVARFDKAIPVHDPSGLKICHEEFKDCNYKKECERRVECKALYKVFETEQKRLKEEAKKARKNR